MLGEVIWDSFPRETKLELELALGPDKMRIGCKDEDTLMVIIRKDPDSVFDLGFGPRSVPLLVNLYPRVTVAIFESLNGHPRISE